MAPLSRPAAEGSALGYLALAPSVFLFTLDHAGLLSVAPEILTWILLLGGALQLAAGLRARQAGQMATAAVFLPLGLFWFSMVGFCLLPAMGIGRAPTALQLLVYLTLWGLFAALLYLGSFRSSRVLQLVFCSLMISLLLMAVSAIRDNLVFDGAAAIAGAVCGLGSLYSGLAACLNRGCGRELLPLGRLTLALEDEGDGQFSN